MSIAKLDLTQDSELTIHIERGVVYAPSISGFTTLDTGYTLVLNNITYTVGNGLSLVDTQTLKSIVWALDGGDYQVGIYRGNIISDSRTAGTYLNIQIVLIVE